MDSSSYGHVPARASNAAADGIDPDQRPWYQRPRTWWAIMPAVSAGMLAAVPVAHAAIKTGERRLWRWVAIYAVGSLAAGVLMGSDPSSADPQAVEGWRANVGVAIALVLAVAGTIHAFHLRPFVFPTASGSVLGPGSSPNADAALAAALAARERRNQARRIVDQDPALARDLRIGRPDLTRDYDDGGLVDVNHVPTTALVAALGWTEDEARTAVAARDKIGGFRTAAELSAYSNLSPERIDAVADLLVFLRT